MIQSTKAEKDVAYLTVQTVFEGFGTNTARAARSAARRHGITIPVGHDAGRNNTGSRVMKRYRSGGTPWFVIIDKAGIVRFNGFHVRPAAALRLIRSLR